ncbi:PorV/PorQ family protein [Polaribacter sargassicola]|uniref:putative type IX sorting system protein PorV2 n=1 Tax=Polaribacter sargassicola TaxID=2836891 RepID=UPI001F3982F0|nr:PorV/PorQ family protein [Polaribacter sp. DS7-9]MCG1036621.1 PorV/PorQ family protein [Polaribacter sp. DS7-9]
MKHKLLLIFLIIPLFLSAQAFRNYSNEFLSIGVDAAGLGMSKSVVATTNDVNSIYWNPAGLVGIEDYQGSLMHASYFAGIASYNHASFAMPIDKESTFAISLIRFGVDDILNTTELIDNEGNIDFNRIQLFSSVDYAFNFAYAKKLIFKDLKFGINAKIVRRIIGDFASSWGFGFDAGIQFERNSWNFGLMARDVTTTFNSWAINEDEFNKIKDAIPGQNEDLPETTEITKPKIQLGVAKYWDINHFFNLLTEINANIRFTETNDVFASEVMSVDPAMGFQLDYDKIVYLRAGVGNFQYITEFDNSKSLSMQPNFGVGFNYNGIKIDYALTNIGSVGNALYSNIFSITIDYSFFRH